MDCWPSVLSRTKGQYDAGDRYRTLLPDYHFTVVYDAVGAEQPEALAYIALEFFERRDLFLVSREGGMAFSLSEELQAFKFDSRVRNELRAEAMIPVPGCGCRSPPATSTWAASRAVNIMRLELILRTVDVPEPLQRIRA